jgi:cytochrome c oxidase subunit 2
MRPNRNVRGDARRTRQAIGRAGRLAAASCIAALAGCTGQPLPPGATEQAHEMHAVWVTFFWSGIGVAAVVYGLIAWCLLRYRRKPTDTQYPPQFRRNNRMEIVYTIVPIAMVCGLFAITYAAERHVETIAGSQDLIVNVTGFRWGWRFEYPELGIRVTGTSHAPPQLVLPEGKTVRFDVSSVDVDHSFWVPAFLFKRDAIPGLQNVFDWTPTALGTFRGECGEFCGLDHALMTFTVRVTSPAQFAAWARAQPRVRLERPSS